MHHRKNIKIQKVIIDETKMDDKDVECHHNMMKIFKSWFTNRTILSFYDQKFQKFRKNFWDEIFPNKSKILSFFYNYKYWVLIGSNDDFEKAFLIRYFINPILKMLKLFISGLIFLSKSFNDFLSTKNRFFNKNFLKSHCIKFLAVRSSFKN